jgi:uncharacterized protein involved in response to NO
MNHESTSARQAPFATFYLHGALLMALGAGFFLAAYLGTHLGFGLPLSVALPAIIQAHGQAQILGWLGLFIMGVSLHFLPRLSGVPLGAYRRWLPLPGWFVVGSVACRSVAQPALALMPEADWPAYALVCSGIALVAGVGLYVGLIALILSRRRMNESTHRKIAPLRPWLLLVLAGWLATGGVLAWGTIEAGMAGTPMLDRDLQLLGVDLFIGAVLIPIAFVFARQVLPLYLRVDMMQPRSLPLLALAYATTLAAVTAARLLSAAFAEDVAAMLQAALILWIFASLRIHRQREQRGKYQPERDGAARFGVFAPAIYLSFGFLLLAASAQLLAAAGSLGGVGVLVKSAGIRHAQLAGFGTLLLLGVAPRMLPGFLGARGPAWPALVRPAWILGAVAAFGVCVGLGLPAASLPWWARMLFGASGTLGWFAVALLAANLWATLRQAR